jgi:hypothetical protein
MMYQSASEHSSILSLSNIGIELKHAEWCPHSMLRHTVVVAWQTYVVSLMFSRHYKSACLYTTTTQLLHTVIC